jgi:hypothetical protein
MQPCIPAGSGARDILLPWAVTLQIKPHRFLHISSHTHSRGHAPHVIPT